MIPIYYLRKCYEQQYKKTCPLFALSGKITTLNIRNTVLYVQILLVRDWNAPSIYLLEHGTFIFPFLRASRIIAILQYVHQQLNGGVT
jgi:hypothetical protein